MKLNRIKRSRWVGLAALAGVEVTWGTALAVARWSRPSQSHSEHARALQGGFLSQILIGGVLAVAMIPSIQTGNPRAWVHASMVVAAACLASLGWAFAVFATDASLAAPLRLVGVLGAGAWAGCAVSLWRFCQTATSARRRKLTGPVDAVVVLGAGLMGRLPAPLLAHRVDRGIAAALDPTTGRVPLICTGGQGPDEPCTEAEAMADYVRRSGAEVEVLQEPRAVNTRENIHFSLEILESRGIERPRIAIATSDFHVRRTELTVEAISAQRPVVAEVLGAATPPASVLHSYVREFVALSVWNLRRAIGRYLPARVVGC